MDSKDKVIILVMFLLLAVVAAMIIMNKNSVFRKIEKFTEDDTDDEEGFDEQPVAKKDTDKTVKTDTVVKTDKVEQDTPVEPIKSVQLPQTQSNHSIGLMLKQTLGNILNALDITNTTPQQKQQVIKELFEENNIQKLMSSTATGATDLVNNVLHKFVSQNQTEKFYEDDTSMQSAIESIKTHVKAALNELENLGKKPSASVPVPPGTERFTSSSVYGKQQSNTHSKSIEGFENTPTFALY
jgi:hypothetical protein